MISNEKQTRNNRQTDSQTDETRYFIRVRRGEIEARLKPLEAQLKSERNGEKRVSLLIEHATLLKELCLLNVGKVLLKALRALLKG
ncbi:MAG: hypothetical protein K2I20_01585 [Clostridia bacterium]|nr:hypothetical protein [Clostridia bacterium]